MLWRRDLIGELLELQSVTAATIVVTVIGRVTAGNRIIFSWLQGRLKVSLEAAIILYYIRKSLGFKYFQF